MKGSFTGAIADHPGGLFVAADKARSLLDEIGDMRCRCR